MPAAINCCSTAAIVSPLARMREPSRLHATYRPAYWRSCSWGKFRWFSEKSGPSSGTSKGPLFSLIVRLLGRDGESLALADSSVSSQGLARAPPHRLSLTSVGLSWYDISGTPTSFRRGPDEDRSVGWEQCWRADS